MRAILLAVLLSGCGGITVKTAGPDGTLHPYQRPACPVEESVSEQLSHPWTEEQLKAFGGNPPPLFLFHTLDGFMGRVAIAAAKTAKDIAPNPDRMLCDPASVVKRKNDSQAVPRRWYARFAGFFHKAPMAEVPILPATIAGNLVETFTAGPNAASAPLK